MGIVSSTTEIGVNGVNIRYYEEKGYLIPRIKEKYGVVVKKGTKIKVNVEDLFPNSKAIVTIECDICKKKYDVTYQYYTNHNHNGLCYCNSCSKKVFCSGENNYCWNSHKTVEERKIRRNYKEYKDFIKKVLLRDKFTCYCCGESHGNMEVHHLNGYNWFTDGRTDETNAITLCHNCHSNFHIKYGKGNNTKEQFNEWMGIITKELAKYNGKLPTTKNVYCLEDSVIYNSVEDAAKHYNVDKSGIYNMCMKKTCISKNGVVSYRTKSLKGKHFLWYSDYIKMSDEDIKLYIEQCKNIHKRKVICLTTNIIFESLKEASKFYNIASPSDILYCCKGKHKNAGKLKDGTRLKWAYYD